MRPALHQPKDATAYGLAKGTYKCTRIGEGQFSELSFTHADLGLPEPEPVPVVPEPDAGPLRLRPLSPEPTPEPEPKFAPTALGPIELKAEADRRFADDYKRGLVGDSAGNKIDGTNDQRPTLGQTSLLGPMEPMTPVRPDCTAHMDSALVGDILTAPNPVDTDEFQELWHAGHADRKARMYQQAGLRQPSEQDRKKCLDRAAIEAAFRQGYVR